MAAHFGWLVVAEVEIGELRWEEGMNEGCNYSCFSSFAFPICRSEFGLVLLHYRQKG